MSRRELVRVAEPTPAGDRVPPWKHYGRTPTGARSGCGVILPDFYLGPSRLRTWEEGLAWIREILFEAPSLTAWIGDAEGRVEFYRLARRDDADEQGPLPDVVGKVIPFAPRSRGVEKVAAGGRS